MLPVTAREVDDDELDLRAYLGVLRRRWLSIIAVMVIVVGVALAVSLRQEPQYRSGSEVLVRPSRAEGIVTDQLGVTPQEAVRQLNNEVRLLESGAIRDAVAEAYDGPLDPTAVSAAVSSDTSDVVEVSLTAADPQDAAALVNVYVETFIEVRRQQRVDELLAAGAEIQIQLDDLAVQVDEVRQPLDEAEAAVGADPENGALQAARDDLRSELAAELAPLESQRAIYQQLLDNLQLTAGITSSGGAMVLTPADAPAVPVSPKPVRDAAVALVLGAMLGAGLAFLRDNLDERVRSVSDLERAVPGVATLAVVPEIEQAKAPRYVAARDDPRSVAAESYRSLRTAVKFAGIERPLRVVQITSPLSGDGKTTTVANLAVAFAQGGDRVAVMCCDLRRPRVQERFDEPLTPGLTDVLLGDVSLQDALRQTAAGVHLLPAGSPPPNPSELLSSERAAAVVEVLTEQFDVVVIDSTPVLPVTDSLVISRLVDATILVVNSQTTKRNALRRTIQMLNQVSAPVLGFVVTGVEADGGYGYGYGYGYGHEAYAEDDRSSGPERKGSRRARWAARRQAGAPTSGSATAEEPRPGERSGLRPRPAVDVLDPQVPDGDAGPTFDTAGDEHPTTSERGRDNGSDAPTNNGRKYDGPADIRPGASWRPGDS